MNISYTQPGNPAGNAALRYLALGDSYTIGQSVNEDQRWPVLLVDTMRSAGFSINDAEIIAQTGWTTMELMTAIEAAPPEGPYDLVSLLIGVNNQYRGLDTGEYRQEFKALLQTALSLAGEDSGVIVVSIPDYSVTPFAQNMNPAKIAEEIKTFNRIKREESFQAGLPFIDVTPISRLAGDQPGLLAEDGLHPSGEMYAAWVKLIFPVVVDMFKNKP